MIEEENHPLEPFLPPNAELLMLGSFPPKKERWKMDFYYPNLQNDMWRIFGLCFFEDKDYFITPDKKNFEEEKLHTFLKQKGIAISDVAESAIRLKDNASDNFLQIVKIRDIEVLLQSLPHCKALVTTGKKATDTLISKFKLTEPKIGESLQFEINGKPMLLYRMPSSSRAYPKPLAEKMFEYKKMFSDLGLL